MATYTTQSVSGPNQTTVIDLTGEIELNNNKIYTASIELTGESSNFKFNTTNGLEAAFGFEFEEEITNITLSGKGADIENAFNQIIYTSGQSVDDTFETVITSDFLDNA